MSLRPHKPLVLFFALGAFALGAVMVYSFGGRNIFTKHEQFLLYFDDSVNGVTPGSLVMFKGVPIGEVDSIRLNLRTSAADHRIPVLIKLNADIIQRQLGVLEDLSDPAVLAAEIHRGLRAELDVEHYTTGSMLVALDFHPDAPAPKAEPNAGGYAIIPTISSAALAHINWTEKQIAWLPSFDFSAEIGQAGDFLDKLTGQVAAIPYSEYHQQIVGALQPLANFDFPAWQRDMSNMVSHFDNDQEQIALASSQYSAASQDFVDMNTAARQNLAQTDADLAALRAKLSPTAPWLQQLTGNLKELSADLDNLTRKTDNLEKQPDILPQITK